MLQVYNVNFLYVLKAYTSKHSSLRDEFKRDAREKFRRNFLSLLREKYYFWALYLPNWESADYKDRLEKFVNDNFRKLVGRVFRSEATPKCLILALERDVVDNSEDGADDDYRKIREIVDGNNCDVFSLLPEEIWGDGQIRRDDMYGWRMPQ